MSVEGVNQRQEQYVQEAKDDSEKQMAARHKRETSEMQRRHSESLNDLREEYDGIIQNGQKKTREALSEREQRHIKDIQELQEAGRKRYVQQKTEDGDQLRRTKDNLEGELERTKKRHNEERSKMSQDFKEEIHKKDEYINKYSEENREGSKDALKSQAKRFQEKHAEDEKLYAKRINDLIKQKYDETTTLRRHRDTEVNRLKNQMEYQQNTSNAKLRDVVQNDGSLYGSSIKELVEDNKQAREASREEFIQKQNQVTDQYAENLENLKKQVNERVETQINSVKRENMNLKNVNAFQRVDNDRRKELEKRNLMTQFRRNLDEQDKRGVEAKNEAHEAYSKNIHALQQRQSLELQKIQADYASKVEELQTNQTAAHDLEVNQVQRESALSKLLAEKQKKKLVDIYADRTQAQTEFFEENIKAKDIQHQESLDIQKNALKKQHVADLSNLRNQLTKQNLEFQEKMTDITSRYENQIQKMRVEYEKRMRLQNNAVREQSQKQMAAQKNELEVQEMQHKQRMTAMKETYENQMEDLRKRQAAERQEWAKKSNS